MGNNPPEKSVKIPVAGDECSLYVLLSAESNRIFKKRAAAVPWSACVMSVTYYVALSFVQGEHGCAPGEAQECPSAQAAIRRADAMSRRPVNAGAVAFKRSGDPNLGEFSDAVVLKTFGSVPDDLGGL